MKRLTGTLTRVRLSDRFLKRWHPTSKVFSRQDTKENGKNHGKASTMEKSFAALNDGLADKKRKSNRISSNEDEKGTTEINRTHEKALREENPKLATATRDWVKGLQHEKGGTTNNLPLETVDEVLMENTTKLDLDIIDENIEKTSNNLRLLLGLIINLKLLLGLKHWVMNQLKHRVTQCDKGSSSIVMHEEQNKDIVLWKDLENASYHEPLQIET
ncbi:hypothetical protein H5410_041100 [Solanum commersonii]|uniref:Uncharacterized protein n=1 Tax=Solanum commersonii TaxID=4109 RepID=A0A9J5XS26_SOLCO|nr:hypothetical protein H5410_041100 [Solanum commersonii]